MKEEEIFNGLVQVFICKMLGDEMSFFDLYRWFSRDGGNEIRELIFKALVVAKNKVADYNNRKEAKVKSL